MSKVSVIVPTYNRGYIVRRAVDSILAQTLTDFEVLVVDDGSTDDTRAVIKSIMDERVQYFYKENGGVSSARNLGLSESSGEYIAFLDSDDVWPEDFLRVMTEHLDENPDFGLAYTATTLRFPDGKEVPDDIRRCPSGRITTHLFKHSTIWPMAVVMRRSGLQNFWFDEALKVCDDNDAFLRLSVRTKFMFVPGVWVMRNWSRDSHSVAAYLEGPRARILSLERFYNRLGGNKLVSALVAKRKLGNCYRRAGIRHSKEGYHKAAVVLLRRAIRYKPTDARLYIDMARAVLLSKRKDRCTDWQMPEPLGPPYSTFSSLNENRQTLRMISNIVFTRNRPFQLEGYLESLYRHIPRQLVRTYIIYKEDLFDEQYCEVFKRFEWCIVIRENDFHKDFVNLIERIDTEYILFGTDDVVYYDSAGFDIIDRAFERFGDEVFGFTLRLCPENLSFEADRFSPIQLNGQTVYRVNWKRAKNKQAKYPFELNSTIYRTCLVKKILKPVAKKRSILMKIFTKDSLIGRFLGRIISMKHFLISISTFHDPNTLEGYCHKWCTSHKSKLPDYLFFQKLCASAIQVNTVSTTVENPVDVLDGHTIESLNEKYKQGYRFDVEEIEKARPEATHVGGEYFRLVRQKR